MDRLAIIEEEKIVQATVRFPFEEKIKTMDRLVIIREQKIVQTTVTISISRQQKLWVD